MQSISKETLSHPHKALGLSSNWVGTWDSPDTDLKVPLVVLHDIITTRTGNEFLKLDGINWWGSQNHDLWYVDPLPIHAPRHHDGGSKAGYRLTMETLFSQETTRSLAHRHSTRGTGDHQTLIQSYRLHLLDTHTLQLMFRTCTCTIQQVRQR